MDRSNGGPSDYDPITRRHKAYTRPTAAFVSPAGPATPTQPRLPIPPSPTKRVRTNPLVASYVSDRQVSSSSNDSAPSTVFSLSQDQLNQALVKTLETILTLHQATNTTRFDRLDKTIRTLSLEVHERETRQNASLLEQAAKFGASADGLAAGQREILSRLSVLENSILKGREGSARPLGDVTPRSSKGINSGHVNYSAIGPPFIDFTKLKGGSTDGPESPLVRNKRKRVSFEAQTFIASPRHTPLHLNRPGDHSASRNQHEDIKEELNDEDAFISVPLNLQLDQPGSPSPEDDSMDVDSGIPASIDPTQGVEKQQQPRSSDSPLRVQKGGEDELEDNGGDASALNCLVRKEMLEPVPAGRLNPNAEDPDLEIPLASSTYQPPRAPPLAGVPIDRAAAQSSTPSTPKSPSIAQARSRLSSPLISPARPPAPAERLSSNPSHDMVQNRTQAMSKPPIQAQDEPTSSDGGHHGVSDDGGDEYEDEPMVDELISSPPPLDPASDGTSYVRSALQPVNSSRVASPLREDEASSTSGSHSRTPSVTKAFAEPMASYNVHGQSIQQAQDTLQSQIDSSSKPVHSPSAISESATKDPDQMPFDIPEGIRFSSKPTPDEHLPPRVVPVISMYAVPTNSPGGEETNTIIPTPSTVSASSPDTRATITPPSPELNSTQSSIIPTIEPPKTESLKQIGSSRTPPPSSPPPPLPQPPTFTEISVNPDFWDMELEYHDDPEPITPPTLQGNSPDPGQRLAWTAPSSQLILRTPSVNHKIGVDVNDQLEASALPSMVEASQHEPATSADTPVLTLRKLSAPLLVLDDPLAPVDAEKQQVSPERSQANGDCDSMEDIDREYPDRANHVIGRVESDVNMEALLRERGPPADDFITQIFEEEDPSPGSGERHVSTNRKMSASIVSPKKLELSILAPPTPESSSASRPRPRPHPRPRPLPPPRASQGPLARGIADEPIEISDDDEIEIVKELEPVLVSKAELLSRVVPPKRKKVDGATSTNEPPKKASSSAPLKTGASKKTATSVSRQQPGSQSQSGLGVSRVGTEKNRAISPSEEYASSGDDSDNHGDEADSDLGTVIPAYKLKKRKRIAHPASNAGTVTSSDSQSVVPERLKKIAEKNRRIQKRQDLVLAVGTLKGTGAVYSQVAAEEEALGQALGASPSAGKTKVKKKRIPDLDGCTPIEYAKKRAKHNHEDNKEEAGKRKRVKGKRKAGSVSWPPLTKTEDPSTTQFIQCDVCHAWFHTGCVGIKYSERESNRRFECPPCDQNSDNSLGAGSRDEIESHRILCARSDCPATDLELFEVERIIGRRWIADSNQYQWLIKWENYATEESTWELKYAMLDVKRLVAEFNAELVKEGILSGNRQKMVLLKEAAACKINWAMK